MGGDRGSDGVRCEAGLTPSVVTDLLPTVRRGEASSDQREMAGNDGRRATGTRPATDRERTIDAGARVTACSSGAES